MPAEWTTQCLNLLFKSCSLESIIQYHLQMLLHRYMLTRAEAHMHMNKPQACIETNINAYAYAYAHTGSQYNNEIIFGATDATLNSVRLFDFLWCLGWWVKKWYDHPHVDLHKYEYFSEWIITIKINYKFLLLVITNLDGRYMIPFNIRCHSSNIIVTVSILLQKRNQSLNNLNSKSICKENIIDVLAGRQGETSKPIRGNICAEQ